MESENRRPDAEMQEAFRNLIQHAPRPGYAARFWTRVEAAEKLPVFWHWLPVMATALGLMLGMVLAERTQLAHPRTSGIGALGSLPEGSLAATLAFKDGD